jgi:hypothetical protein
MMEPAQWPQIVEMIEGWWNQPMPAKTATMWYAELRHYEGDRVVEALGRVLHSTTTPFIPPLGLVLQQVRQDGRGLPEHLWKQQGRREALTRNDQFQLTTGRKVRTDEELEAYFSPGTVCADMCGGVGLTVDDRQCFHCGYPLIPDTRPPELGGPVLRDRPLLEAGPPEASVAAL